MIVYNAATCRTIPFAHQTDTTKLVLAKRSFAIFSEQGTGKTKCAVDAACFLYKAGVIDRVVVIAPGAVRSVWVNGDEVDPGEIKKHSFVPSRVHEFRSSSGSAWKVRWEDACDEPMNWIVAGYELLRGDDRLDALLETVGKKTFVVFDESSSLKNRNAEQTKSAAAVRRQAGRAVIINGTPVAHSPLDLWGQLMVLDPNILGKKFENYFHFRSTYAVMGGFNYQKVVRWQNLEGLQKLIAPYCVRYLKKDCLDLPEKIGGISGTTGLVVREVPLTEATWKIYKEMRDDAIVYLQGFGEKSVAPQATSRILRLLQITGGSLGGVETPDDLEKVERDLSSEKIDWLHGEIKSQLELDPKFKCIVWFRFRRERERACERLKELAPVWQIYGGQPEAERDAAKKAFGPSGIGTGAGILGAQPQAGGWGLNLFAAHHSYHFSRDYNLVVQLQSEDRIHRYGQGFDCMYIDVFAVGPQHQRTMNWTVAKNLIQKEDLATYTSSAWVKLLKEERENA